MRYRSVKRKHITGVWLTFRVALTAEEEAERAAEEALFEASRPAIEMAERNQKLIDLEQRRAAAERLGLTEEQSELAAQIAALRGE